jgi:hypothetical protein
MRQQAVVPSANAQRAKEVVSDRQEEQPPPAKKVRNERQRNQQMKSDYGEHVLPQDSTLRIDHFRPGHSAMCRVESRVFSVQLIVDIDRWVGHWLNARPATAEFGCHKLRPRVR